MAARGNLMAEWIWYVVPLVVAGWLCVSYPAVTGFRSPYASYYLLVDRTKPDRRPFGTVVLDNRSGKMQYEVVVGDAADVTAMHRALGSASGNMRVDEGVQSRGSRNMEYVMIAMFGHRVRLTFVGDRCLVESAMPEAQTRRFVRALAMAGVTNAELVSNGTHN